ncbi:unnamed protein product [Caretta caretta]
MKLTEARVRIVLDRFKGQTLCAKPWRKGLLLMSKMERQLLSCARKRPLELVYDQKEREREKLCVWWEETLRKRCSHIGGVGARRERRGEVQCLSRTAAGITPIFIGRAITTQGSLGDCSMLASKTSPEQGSNPKMPLCKEKPLKSLRDLEDFQDSLSNYSAESYAYANRLTAEVSVFGPPPVAQQYDL